VVFSRKPLSDVLTYIRDNSSVSVSFDPVELKKYLVSADTLFSNPQSAIIYLTSKFPLTVTNIDDVLVISGREKKYSISGTVSDKISGERLPYTSVLYDGRRFFSDVNGYFNIISREEDKSEITFYYLGYKVLDTLLSPGVNNSVALVQINILLKELLIESFETGNALQTGERSGILRINHAIARYLPGNGDNSVFNLLRLMPGVRATGESAGFSVWNSKPGESSVVFDGAKLYAMNGYNEQISAINPFMVNEIKVYKGGYGPEFGNQSGAIAQIAGIGGNRNKPELKLNINNLTANLFGSFPISKKSVLALSYRQTYYELYDVNSLNPFGKRSNSPAGAGNGNSSHGNSREAVYITPDYRFKDANIRYSGDLQNGGRFFASLCIASDKFTYSLEDDDNEIDASENNNQLTLSAGVDMPDKRGSVTSIAGNISMLDTESGKIVRLNRQSSYYSLDTQNSVKEGGVKMSRTFGLFQGGDLQAGIEANYMSTAEDGDVSGLIRGSLYLNEKVSLKGATISAGTRGDLYKGKIYVQPRLSASVNLSENLSISGAWGIYNQFLGKVPVIYEDIAPVMVWRLLGEEGHPVMKSSHTVLGTSWNSRSLTLSLEGFIRQTEGISQVIVTGNTPSVKSGNANITGGDLFLKWERKGTQIFASMTAARATESYSDTREYKYDPFEIKSGFLLNLSPVWISGAYIYGDGYLNGYGTGKYSDMGIGQYSRLDISATYNFSIGRAAFRTGVSILNLLNTENRKTLEVLTTPSRGGAGSSLLNLYAESIPFTPTLYLELTF
jgi:hypothetical protein